MMNCTKCGELKENNEFAIRKNDIRQKTCKVCHRAYSKKHYNDRKEYYKEKSKKRRKHYRPIIIDRLNAIRRCYGCQLCDEKDERCLDFHHYNPSQKKFNISGILDNCKCIDVANEINKCIILCASCHRKVTRSVEGHGNDHERLHERMLCNVGSYNCDFKFHSQPSWSMWINEVTK